MRETDPQRYVLPALVALLFLGAFVIVGTSGGGDEASEPADPPARSSTPTPDTTTTPAASRTTTTRSGTSREVTVKAGDTPSSIAEAAGISTERLLELNPDAQPGALRVGQKLKLAP